MFEVLNTLVINSNEFRKKDEWATINETGNQTVCRNLMNNRKWHLCSRVTVINIMIKKLSKQLLAPSR